MSAFQATSPLRPVEVGGGNIPSADVKEFFEDSPQFIPWTDPESGVRSFLLNERVAPFQQSFYFVNPSFSNDGRYYWFYCAFPPAGNANQGRSLAVMDFETGEMHHFPETTFTDASPLVDLRTGEVYWCSGLEIWKRRPEPFAVPELVNRFPAMLAKNRRPWRLATHMTFSADRKSVNLDVEIGGEWFIGHAPLDGGEFVLWQKFNTCYNHAQFSPMDPDVQLIAQDHMVHPVSGEITHYDNRLWLIRRGRKAVPLFPDAIPKPPQMRGGNPHYNDDSGRVVDDERSMHGHEWWGPDGRHIWYLHYGHGVERILPEGGKPELVWAHPTLSHAHTDAEERWLVADNIPPENPEDHKVLFRNLETGKQVGIVSRLPQTPEMLRKYHVHPHPQFCLHDQLICYTTTVRGMVDVAFVPVESLLARTA